MNFTGGSDGKESACSAGDLGSMPGSGRSPGEGNGYPLQYSCLENPRGQRSLVGNNLWGPKESDMTEQLTRFQTGAQHVASLMKAPLILFLGKWVLTFAFECQG